MDIIGPSSIPDLPACLDRRSDDGASPHSTFNYAALSPELAQDLRLKAVRIRDRHASTIKAIIETGTILTAAKEHLEHGQFTAWVEAEIGINVRTARRYMATANW